MMLMHIQVLMQLRKSVTRGFTICRAKQQSHFVLGQLPHRLCRLISMITSTPLTTSLIIFVGAVEECDEHKSYGI